MKINPNIAKNADTCCNCVLKIDGFYVLFFFKIVLDSPFHMYEVDLPLRTHHAVIQTHAHARTHTRWPREDMYIYIYCTTNVYCGTLQHTCNTRQHTATRCNTLQHAAAHCNTLQHAAELCGYLIFKGTLKFKVVRITDPKVP